ncbi:MAG: hypothetical protein EA396_14405 [Anaerolineaceae bacterium]|nr:MAG: hypothetical protein EA396_14405 [Anaerolineaceae bacterium]
MNDDITVMDLNATEDASMMLANVFDEIQKQMAMVQMALQFIEENGRGKWLDAVRDDVDMLQLQLTESAALTADISDYLFDMVNTFRGDSEYVDGDDLEDYE